MPIIQDSEFGKITIRRSAKASQVRMRVAPDGSLRASMPVYAPVFLVKRLVNSSRNELREMLKRSYKTLTFENGMQIGKSHRLVVKTGVSELVVRRQGQSIIVKLPDEQELSDQNVAKAITVVTTAALRIEAKSYLPKRLAYLASKYGLVYRQVRFSHAGSRWGSCSSNGTISLNIALMKLPFEIIDYVLIHELTHTVEMNHSPKFWSLVEKADPSYKEHRKNLKSQSPSI